MDQRYEPNSHALKNEEPSFRKETKLNTFKMPSSTFKVPDVAKPVMMKRTVTNDASIEDYRIKIKADREFLKTSKVYLPRFNQESTHMGTIVSPAEKYHTNEWDRSLNEDIQSYDSLFSSLFPSSQTSQVRKHSYLVDCSAWNQLDSNKNISGNRNNPYLGTQIESKISETDEELNDSNSLNQEVGRNTNRAGTVNNKTKMLQNPEMKNIKKRIKKKQTYDFGKKVRSKKIVYREGDWFCPKCENLNFSFRKSCNMCKTGKPNE